MSLSSQAPHTLQLSNVSKTFPGQLALDSVGLFLKGGEICALIGQNGSGKSTLIKILAGYHRPDPDGVITVDGKEFDLSHHHGEWGSQIRFVHQDLGLVGDLSALDNLAFGTGFEMARFGRISWRSQAREARRLFESLNVRIDVRKPVAQLSAVQRTMVAVARAMRDLEDGRGVLVLDEPTAALSQPEVKILFDVIRRAAARGIAVLFVSHRLDEVLDLADVVAVLRDGKLVATPRVSELDHDQLVELMVGKALSVVEVSKSQPQKAVVLSVEELVGERLRGVSFALHSGEILGVSGLDGSGREELALLLFGAVSPRGGKIVLGGNELSGGVPAAIGEGMALVPAHRATQGVFPTFTVRENMTIARLRPLWDGLLKRKRERAETLDWAERVDLRPRETERPIAELSGGNQQKTMLARWLRTDPKVLLLDEPTHGVDVGAKAQILELVGKSVGVGNAVLIMSSEAEDLAHLCDRVLVLNGGDLIAELWGESLTADAVVSYSLQKNPADAIVDQDDPTAGTPLSKRLVDD